MPRTGMKTKAAVVLLMMMLLVHDKATSSLLGNPYYAPHDLLASIVFRPARPGKPQVSRTVIADMDAYSLVVPHQPQCHLQTLLLLLLRPPCHRWLHA